MCKERTTCAYAKRFAHGNYQRVQRERNPVRIRDALHPEQRTLWSSIAVEIP